MRVEGVREEDDANPLNIVVAVGIGLVLLATIIPAVYQPPAPDPVAQADAQARIACEAETSALRAERNTALRHDFGRVAVNQGVGMVTGALAGKAVGSSAGKGAVIGGVAAGTAAALEDPEDLATKSKALARAMGECLKRRGR